MSIIIGSKGWGKESNIKSLREGSSSKNMLKDTSFDFEIKLLTAPGKRKDLDRQELAEDVAGFACYNKHVVFWLVDGAPGPPLSHIIKGVSSISLLSLENFGLNFWLSKNQ